MGQLDFYKHNKKLLTETVRTTKPSPEQILFANTVLEIINPTAEKYGFSRHRTQVEYYSACIVFRKGEQYIKICSNAHPRDYPSFYNFILGEGDSEVFMEYDWNSVALWRLKSKIEITAKAEEYPFPLGDRVKSSVAKANKELQKYADTFLRGDLALFYEARSEQNKGREPYKVYAPDGNGHYTASELPESVEQKRKYS